MLHRLLVVLTVAIFSQVLLAQAPAKLPNNPDATKKPPGNCTVSGRVVSAADGAPLRSARVGLIQANERRHPLVYATTTDNEGHFEIKQIEAGRYEFFASHVGFLEQQYQAKGTEDGVVLALTSGQTFNDGMFRLVRAAVITGKVVDDSDEPMMGVTVSVLRRLTEEELEDAGPRARKQELNPVSVGTTDDRGEYRIYGLKPGEYYIKAAETGEFPPFGGAGEAGSSWMAMHETGSQYAPLLYPGVLQIDQAQPVVVTAGEEAHADFAMRRIKTTEVAGRVVGADGSPASRAYVALRVPNVNDWGGGVASGTDSKGEFSIKGVPPGSYILSASQSEQGRHYHAQQKVEVGEEKIDSIVIAIGRGAKLQGRIIASDSGPVTLNRVQVHLGSISDDETGNSVFTEINKDGTFELDGVTDGSYVLHVGGIEQGWFVKSAHLGSEDVLQNGLQMEKGAAGGTLEIVIASDGAQLEGTVTDSDQNQPLAGVHVKANLDPQTDFNRFRSRENVTDQNGHYVLKDIPPRKYKVSARMPSSGGSAQAIKSDPVVVTLGEREHRAFDIKLTVPKSD